MSSGQWIWRSPDTPFPRMRRDHSMSSPAPTSIFFGSHPRRAQVPPYGSSSMTATCQPAARHLYAGTDAAEPVPMTTRSNGFFIPRSNAQGFTRMVSAEAGSTREVFANGGGPLFLCFCCQDLIDLRVEAFGEPACGQRQFGL